MDRTCTRCHRPFALADLSREETNNLEAGRKAAGLEGVKFLYLHGPACGMADLFWAVLPLETGFAEDYAAHRGARGKGARGGPARRPRPGTRRGLVVASVPLLQPRGCSATLA